MRILGVDPGLVTGVVSFAISDDQRPICIEHYELDYVGVGQYFESTLASSSYSTIVACESFIITTKTGKNSQAPWSLECIGIVKYLCSKSGVPVIMQSAHVANGDPRLVTNGVLKRAGLYFPGKVHARDAACHAMFLAIDKYNLLTQYLKEDGDDAG